jgi:hypothetical protein
LSGDWWAAAWHASDRGPELEGPAALTARAARRLAAADRSTVAADEERVVTTISEQRRVPAPPSAVYAVVSDPVRTAALSPECYRVRWLDDPRGDPVGARFRGYNRHGPFRWWTTANVVAAEPDRRFAYTVSILGIPVADWSYELEPDGDGTLVRESTTDRRGRLLTVTAPLTTGVRDREEHNRRGMRATLERLEEHLASRSGAG